MIKIRVTDWISDWISEQVGNGSKKQEYGSE